MINDNVSNDKLITNVQNSILRQTVRNKLLTFQFKWQNHMLISKADIDFVVLYFIYITKTRNKFIKSINK